MLHQPTIPGVWLRTGGCLVPKTEVSRLSAKGVQLG